MGGLCEACGTNETTSLGRLLASLRGDGQPVVVVDAIDEAASSPAERARGHVPIVGQVLAPLIAAAHRTRLRLVLGTRRHLLQPLTDDGPEQCDIVDLDDAAFADPTSVSRYARACLTELSPASPYRHQEPRYLDSVAQAIAEAAGSSFLVALITARTLALTPALVDATDSTWRASLPRFADQAMAADLDQRLGDEADHVRDLLLPLAYAKERACPGQDVWPALAARCGRAPLLADSVSSSRMPLSWVTDWAS